MCLLPASPGQFLSPHSCGIYQCCCLPAYLIPPQMFQITPVYFIASLLFLVWVLLTCLKRISCFWISHVTLIKVLYSSESTEHLLCCRLAVFRWQHYKSLAAVFDLIEWANLSKDAKVYNWEFSLQVLAYAEHLQAIKYTEINPTLHQMMHFQWRGILLPL